MRGDRPARPTRRRKGVEAAPHARGSTLPVTHATALRAGCPACAGIDLRVPVTRESLPRLPRMRGDRPLKGRYLYSVRGAAPHARGSTRGLLVLVGPVVGCPACAGIDPHRTRCPSRSPRLPRMRGDRPAAGRARAAEQVAAPHARGSTRLPWPSQCQASGCPACAGIDPARPSWPCTRRGLPRMRGDRPHAMRGGAPLIAAAPHARGSTRAPRRVGRRCAGCPACAGIDPRLAQHLDGDGGLPRMRGDRPTPVCERSDPKRAAPHARGSTRRFAGMNTDITGCPACAGIDPESWRTSSSRRWLPRMRGDRPYATLLGANTTRAAPHARGSTRPSPALCRPRAGCPACAGIDPSYFENTVDCSGLPRMRGDRPAVPPPLAEAVGAAPHARGSTRALLHPCVVYAGCPACAGIDLVATQVRRLTPRLPRMRGDRPTSC